MEKDQLITLLKNKIQDENHYLKSVQNELNRPDTGINEFYNGRYSAYKFVLDCLEDES